MPAAPLMNVIASAQRTNDRVRPGPPRQQQQQQQQQRQPPPPQQHSYYARGDRASGLGADPFAPAAVSGSKIPATAAAPAFGRTGRSVSKTAVRRPRTPSRVAAQLGPAGGGWLQKATAAAAASRLRGSSAGASARAGRPAHGQWVSKRQSRVTLVLDLDETLVHSSFDPVPADLHLPVALDGEVYTAYVKKRPFVDEFLARCTELFDVVVWTASLAVYADPLVDELCRSARCGNVKRMFRESCTQLASGGYAKDLAKCGRSLDDVCILDNSPSVAQLQPRNLIPIVSWYDDPADACLRDLLPHLERLAMCGSVHDVIPSLPGPDPEC